jgi:hypothetical protein
LPTFTHPTSCPALHRAPKGLLPLGTIWLPGLRATGVSITTGGQYRCITRISVEAKDADGQPEIHSVESSGYNPATAALEGGGATARWRAAAGFVSGLHVRALKHYCGASSGGRAWRLWGDARLTAAQGQTKRLEAWLAAGFV